MRLNRTALGLLLAASLMSVSISAGHEGGRLRIAKECSHYDYTAGSYCSITASNVAAIPVGSTVYYTQAAVNPATPQALAVALDSNVILFVATGDWATGRCTLEPNFRGLCTFTDGVGELAGFHARVDVAPTGGPNFSWIGTYGSGGENDK